MSFEELWKLVEKLHALPDMATDHVPSTLSDSTKERLAGMSPIEVEKIVTAAMDEVNRGSIAPLDELIKKRL